MSTSKKFVVIGGTGLIGSKAVAILRNAGHDVVVASSRNGINAFTGEGLEAALSGADAVIDVSNMMSFDEPVLRNFFATSSRNLTAAEKAAGVRHHVVLSIVGTSDLVSNPYISGKQAQEEAVQASGQDYTIVRATQFYEFMDTLAEAYTADGAVTVPDIEFQPIAADDVAAALVRVALGNPHHGIVDLAGPDRAGFDEIMRTYLAAKGDRRSVRVDASLGYFGAPVTATSLVPMGAFMRGEIAFSDWLQQQTHATQVEKA
ncbi:SDR family oxidoreductase [Rhizobium mesosinicum]|uniref:SDR family oxidoreductase n=1 Tax=Rhizobium mesosinicum TaxID=335017 RepID=A0ABS7H2Y8_9HYPH|nr:SDR family oxidoreductase [Rhizobium mesosinicum]MBW9056534.1 SDR family oxidoreductase [Rhizobium mesosinicum]